MADALDSGEGPSGGFSIEGENMDQNQLASLFAEWLESDVENGLYR